MICARTCFRMVASRGSNPRPTLQTVEVVATATTTTTTTTTRRTIAVAMMIVMNMEAETVVVVAAGLLKEDEGAVDDAPLRGIATRSAKSARSKDMPPTPVDGATRKAATTTTTMTRAPTWPTVSITIGILTPGQRITSPATWKI